LKEKGKKKRINQATHLEKYV